MTHLAFPSPYGPPFRIVRHRIAVEEKTLLRIVGAPDREFMRTRRWRPIPFAC